MKDAIKKIKEFGADIVLLSVAISWGTTFVIVQDAIKDTPVYSFLFMRFFLSFLLVAIISVKFRKELSVRLIISGFFLGTLFFLGYATQTYGLIYTKSSIVAFITGLNVIFVPIVLYVLFKQKVYYASIVGAFLATFGLWMLTGANSLTSLGKGEFYSLLCALLFAIHIVYTARISKNYNLFLLVSVQLFSVSLFSLIASLVYDPYTIPKSFSYPLVLALVTTVLFATVYALLMQTYMQRFTTPAKTAIIFTMEPASAAIFSYYYADETLSTIQIAGAVTMLMAMIVSEVGSYFRKR